MKTASDLRSELVKCFFMCRDGSMSGDALRGVIGCANQINISLNTEMKYRLMQERAGQKLDSFGEMPITKG